MNQIDAKSVRSGLGFFKVGWGEIYPSPLAPDQSGLPPFTEYLPNYNIGDSTSEISIGLGFKTFQYEGEEPVCSYGDLISITPNFDNATVEGEMRGMVQTYSFEGGISTIVVEVYYSDMRALTVPFENKWSIRFQLNNGSNIVQNPDSPYLSKLSVYDGGSFANGYAEFFPDNGSYTQTQVVIVDTPTHFIRIIKYFSKGTIIVREDMSDIHQPWLGTTVTVNLPRIKSTIETTFVWGDYYYNGPTIETTQVDEPISKEYSHTFTTFDFDPASPDFYPAPEGLHYPSKQVSQTPDYVSEWEWYHEERWEYKSFIDTGPATYVQTYVKDITDSRGSSSPPLTIKTVTPPSFFDPPFAP